MEKKSIRKLALNVPLFVTANKFILIFSQKIAKFKDFSRPEINSLGFLQHILFSRSFQESPPYLSTVKPVLSGHSKRRPKIVY